MKRVTTRAPARDRKAQRPACHRPSSEGFPRGLRPLPVASGTPGKARHLLRRASLRRPKRVADSPGGGRLLQDELASAQNRVSWAVLVSWWQVNSRGRPVSFSWWRLLLAAPTEVS